MAIADKSLLEAALVGYEQQHAKILEAIKTIRAQLGGKRTTTPAAITEDGEKPRKRRKMSAAARRRIAEAQKKRWAAYHKQNAA